MEPGINRALARKTLIGGTRVGLHLPFQIFLPCVTSVHDPISDALRCTMWLLAALQCFQINQNQISLPFWIPVTYKWCIFWPRQNMINLEFVKIHNVNVKHLQRTRTPALQPFQPFSSSHKNEFAPIHILSKCLPFKERPTRKGHAFHWSKKVAENMKVCQTPPLGHSLKFILPTVSEEKCSFLQSDFIWLYVC